jgi:Transposase DDE domain
MEHKMQVQYEELSSKLQIHLSWHKARIKFLSLLIFSLIRNRSVSYSVNASTLNNKQVATNLRRIQRFFGDFSIDFDAIAQFLELLIPIKAPYRLSLDRTNWKFADVNFNILCLNVIADGVALPLLWTMLFKRGNSDQQERQLLIQRFIRLFGIEKIDCLVADREFVGQDWVAFLSNHPIKFYIRIRENMQINHQNKKITAFWWFNNLPLNTVRQIPKPVQLKGQWVYLSGMKLINKKGQLEFLIVATYQFDSQTMQIYAQRWSIECFFKAIKTAGFNIEITHLIDPKRLEKLFAIVAIAFSWIHLIGLYQNQQKEIRLKTHGRKEFSIFRYGLDACSNALIFDYQVITTFIKLLSCT